MNILVTGTTGYIGNVVAKQLTDEGHEVTGLDLRSTDKPQSFRAVQCDICDAEALTATIAAIRPEVVIHLAAQTDIRGETSIENYPANIQGVENLIVALAQVGTCRQAVYTSTQLVCRPGYRPQADTDYCPHTFYGHSKVQTELIIRERASAVSDWCLIRPTSIWGPGMSDHYQAMLRFIQRGVYFHCGRAGLYKSFGYIDNAAFQICRLATAQADQIAGKTFYIADYEPVSLRKYTNDLARGLNARSIPTLPLPLVNLLARIGDGVCKLGLRRFPFNSFRLNNILTEYTFDTTELATVCGPTPITYDEGIARTVAWYKALQGRSGSGS